MKQLAEYTTKNLYSEFKSEEICFVIEKEYDDINELSTATGYLEDALFLSKLWNKKIFIFKKKFASDYLDPYMFFQNMLDDFEEEGLDSTYMLNYIGADGTREFKELIEQWFDKYVGNDYWFPGEPVGVLKK